MLVLGASGVLSVGLIGASLHDSATRHRARYLTLMLARCIVSGVLTTLPGTGRPGSR